MLFPKTSLNRKFTVLVNTPLSCQYYTFCQKYSLHFSSGPDMVLKSLKTVLSTLLKVKNTSTHTIYSWFFCSLRGRSFWYSTTSEYFIKAWFFLIVANQLRRWGISRIFCQQFQARLSGKNNHEIWIAIFTIHRSIYKNSWDIQPTNLIVLLIVIQLWNSLGE